MTVVFGFFRAVLFFTYRPVMAERARPEDDPFLANLLTSFRC